MWGSAWTSPAARRVDDVLHRGAGRKPQGRVLAGANRRRSLWTRLLVGGGGTCPPDRASAPKRRDGSCEERALAPRRGVRGTTARIGRDGIPSPEGPVLRGHRGGPPVPLRVCTAEPAGVHGCTRRCAPRSLQGRQRLPERVPIRLADRNDLSVDHDRPVDEVLDLVDPNQIRPVYPNETLRGKQLLRSFQR